MEALVASLTINLTALDLFLRQILIFLGIISVHLLAYGHIGLLWFGYGSNVFPKGSSVGNLDPVYAVVKCGTFKR
jgi:hypothetical protein